MTQEIAEKVYAEIAAADRIVISRHIRPDGDAVGSSMGLRAIIKATFPEKEVLYVGGDKADYLAFFENEDEMPDDEFCSSALLIVLDSGTLDRVSNEKIGLFKRIVKLDHHIDDNPFGDLSVVEELRTSTCELIVDLCVKLGGKLKMTAEAAEYLYIGMVTDSGRFRFNGTTGETLRYAAMLLDYGFNTERIFANLYLDSFENLSFRSRMFGHIKQTENGVAYIFVSKEIRESENITLEQASQTVMLLDSIKNDLIWLAFIETDDGEIRVRLRSRFVGIKDLASRYGGGGHENASGATCRSLEEVDSLINDADAILADFKKNNTGWL